MAALWLWFNPGRRRLLAFIASCLLLSGPLFHIVQPAIDQANETHIESLNQVAEINLLKRNITSMETALNVSLKNSQKRLGWLNDIQATKTELNSARDDLRTLLAAPVLSPGPWPWLKSLMQALALLIVWSVSVLAISDITKRKTETATKPVIIPASVSKQKQRISKQLIKEKGFGQVKEIIEALDVELKEKGLTQKQWANDKGLSAKYVSLLRTHDERKQQNKETASPAFINRISVVLGLTKNTNEPLAAGAN